MRITRGIARDHGDGIDDAYEIQAFQGSVAQVVVFKGYAVGIGRALAQATLAFAQAIVANIVRCTWVTVFAVRAIGCCSGLAASIVGIADIQCTGVAILTDEFVSTARAVPSAVVLERAGVLVITWREVEYMAALVFVACILGADMAIVALAIVSAATFHGDLTLAYAFDACISGGA